MEPEAPSARAPATPWIARASVWLAGAALLALLSWQGSGPWLEAGTRDDGERALEVVQRDGLDATARIVARRRAADSSRLEVTGIRQSLRARALFRTEAGAHRLIFRAADYGRVAVDGVDLIDLPRRRAPTGQTGQASPTLTAGVHLVEVDAGLVAGRGWASLAVQGPGDAEPRPLDRERLVATGDLDTMAQGLAVLRGLAPLAWMGLAVAAVLFGLGRWGRRRTALVVGCVAAVVLPWTAVAPRGEKFPFVNADLPERIAAEKPDFVFVGNSMMNSRIDAPHLSALLAGAPVHLIWLPGTRSAEWYLALRHYVVASGHRPKATFLFFRDNQIVIPRLKAKGRRDIYESLSPGALEDDELFARLVLDEGGFRDTVGRALARALPVSDWGPPATQRVSETAIALAVPARPGADVDRQRTDRLALVNRVFATERLRPEIREDRESPRFLDEKSQLETDLDDERFFDFDRAVGESLLPAIADLAAEHGLHLVLVRIQRAERARGAAEDPRMGPWLDGMRKWTAARAIPFFDLTGDPEIVPAMYGAGDHIAPASQQAWTEIFRRRLAEIFDR